MINRLENCTAFKGLHYFMTYLRHPIIRIIILVQVSNLKHIMRSKLLVYQNYIKNTKQHITFQVLQMTKDIRAKLKITILLLTLIKKSQNTVKKYLTINKIKKYLKIDKYLKISINHCRKNYLKHSQKIPKNRPNYQLLLDISSNTSQAKSETVTTWP